MLPFLAGSCLNYTKQSGGLYQPDHFYEIASELGVMIWQVGWNDVT
jgi:hypothetical protein